MSSFLAGMAGIATLLIVGGVIGLIANSDAGAYEVASKPTVHATVVETHTEGTTKNKDCAVTVSESSGSVTLAITDLSACDPSSPLQPGAHVDVEYWSGKATAIYDDNLSWPTSDNPAQNAALATLAVVGGVLLGILAGVGGGIWWLVRSRRPQHQRAATSPRRRR